MTGDMIRHSKLRHRLIALLLLCAHVCTGTAMIPAMGALLAFVDGSHALVIIRSASGYELVLHHTMGNTTPEIMDHGSVAARMLVFVCKSSPEGDHKLESALLTGADSFKEYLRFGSPPLVKLVWVPGMTAADLHAAHWALPIRGGAEAGLQRFFMQKWSSVVLTTVQMLV